MKINSLFCIIVVILIGLLPFNVLAQDDNTTLVGYIATDSAINVRNRPDGAVISSLPPNISVTVVGKSDDGAWLSVELGDGQTGWVSASFVRVVESAIPADLVPITTDNVDQLENITQLASTLANGFAFSPDGRLLAAYSWRGDIEIYDVRTKILITQLTKHTDIVSDVAFSPDGKTLASSSWDGSVKVWDTQTWGERAAFLGHSDGVNCLAYSPDGELLASVGMDGLLNIWNVESGERVHTIEAGSQRIHNVAFSPDGTKIATASDYVESVLRLWDVATGEPLWRKASGGNLYITFSPDGETIVLANGTSTAITGINIETSQQTFTISVANSSTGSIAINPAGTLVAAGTGSVAFIVADVESEQVLFSDSSGAESPAASVVVAFSPDGRLLITSDSDHGIHLWGVHGSNSSTTADG